MDHLYLFILLINLIVGTVVFLHFHLLTKRYQFVFFKSLRLYILFFNFQILAYFFGKYFYTNIISGAPLYGFPKQFVFVCRFLLFFIAEAGITWTLYRTLIHLLGKEQSRLSIFIFYGWIMVFSGAFGYGCYQIFYQIRYLPYSITEMIWEISFNLIIIITMSWGILYLKRRRINPNTTFSFAVIFFLGYLLYLIPNLYFYITGTGFGEYADPIVLLFINLCPFIWYRLFYSKNMYFQPVNGSGGGYVNQLFESFGISDREREIVHAILNGKSNTQISDDLFLSFHTVKNHVYHIYKKFGVKSRSQLIHKINQYRKKV